MRFFLLPFIVCLLASCGDRVTISHHGSAVDIRSVNGKRLIDINSPAGSARYSVNVPLSFTDSDAIFICFGKRDSVDVVVNHARNKAVVMYTFHNQAVRLDTALPIDTRGVPLAIKYHADNCLEYGFGSGASFPTQGDILITSSKYLAF